MRQRSVVHSIRQLALVMAGFLVTIVLIESDGLASWAAHLELGPLRTVAVPVTAVIHKAAGRFNPAAAARQRALENLARVGWSDDQALVAAVSVPSNPTATVSTLTATPSLAVPAPPSACKCNTTPGNVYANARGWDSPLLSDLPLTAALPPLAPLEQGKTRLVVLTGDSMMAVGLSDTLMRRAAGVSSLRIVKAYHSGTGLTRPEIFNWMDQYPALIGSQKPDVVIVAVGANDGQGFVVDKKVFAFGTPEWIKVYQQRVASYLAMIGAGDAHVVWVGLPPMKSSTYNDRIALINRIDYTVVKQSANATYWNPAPFVADSSGNFREYMTLANGKTMRLRQSDGIHLSDEGADLISAVLIDWLSPPKPKEETAAKTTTSPSSAQD